jgi:hypothetical protein
LRNFDRRSQELLLLGSAWGCSALQLRKETCGQFWFPLCIRSSRPARCEETFS